MNNAIYGKGKVNIGKPVNPDLLEKKDLKISSNEQSNVTFIGQIGENETFKVNSFNKNDTILTKGSYVGLFDFELSKVKRYDWYYKKTPISENTFINTLNGRRFNYGFICPK